MHHGWRQPMSTRSIRFERYVLLIGSSVGVFFSLHRIQAQPSSNPSRTLGLTLRLPSLHSPLFSLHRSPRLSVFCIGASGKKRKMQLVIYGSHACVAFRYPVKAVRLGISVCKKKHKYFISTFIYVYKHLDLS